MNPLAVLTVLTAGLIVLGQWVSSRVRSSIGDGPLPPRLVTRLTWWATHRAGVTLVCAAVAAGGLVGGTLAG